MNRFSEMLESQDYTAGDLTKLVGLTYRQLNDWENRAGVVTARRATADGWRRFNGTEVFALAVCGELRDKFGLSLEKLGKTYQWLMGKKRDGYQRSAAKRARKTLQELEPRMAELRTRIAPLQDEARKLAEAPEDDETRQLLKKNADALIEILNGEQVRQLTLKYATALDDVLSTEPIRQTFRWLDCGFGVYLVIDNLGWRVLPEAVVAKGMWNRKPLQCAVPDASLPETPAMVGAIFGTAILCPLHIVLRTVVGKLRGWKTIEDWNKLVEEFQFLPIEAFQNKPDLTAQERKVIDLIREHDYQSVTVHVQGGRVIEAERETEEPKTEGGPSEREKQILQLLGCGDFETVTVKAHRGKITRLKHKQPVKLNAATEKP